MHDIGTTLESGWLNSPRFTQGQMCWLLNPAEDIKFKDVSFYFVLSGFTPGNFKLDELGRVLKKGGK